MGNDAQNKLVANSKRGCAGAAATRGSAHGFLARLRITVEMIKFEHSIFALPFALTGAMLAARGWPSARQLIWLIAAMVGARSAAMAVGIFIHSSRPQTGARITAKTNAVTIGRM